ARWERAADDRVGIRHGHDRLTGHGHSEIERDRLRHAKVQTLHDRSGMQDEARHQVTFSAPWLTSVMPVKSMVPAVIATFGAVSEIPVCVTMKVLPPQRSMMPPVGPGRSLITMQFCPAVCSTMLGDTGSPARASIGMSEGAPQRQPTQMG